MGGASPPSPPNPPFSLLFFLFSAPLLLLLVFNAADLAHGGFKLFSVCFFSNKPNHTSKQHGEENQNNTKQNDIKTPKQLNLSVLQKWHDIEILTSKAVIVFGPLFNGSSSNIACANKGSHRHLAVNALEIAICQIFEKRVSGAHGLGSTSCPFYGPQKGVCKKVPFQKCAFGHNSLP